MIAGHPVAFAGDHVRYGPEWRREERFDHQYQPACSDLVVFTTLTDALRTSAHPMQRRFERFLPTTP
jgi:hypothetical protein